ncbi:MAG TPA: hypothetical protein DDX98_15555 [Bacteroidales bacterium]|jgi:uncharacterized membrane protein|nr:hypothetical protein [Bacteroidales bacterium]
MKFNLKIDKLIKSNSELSEAEKERGLKQLMRLGTIIDVIYGLMIFRLFLLMPRPEVDNFGAAELVEVLKTSYLNYLAMTVGIVLIIIYWQQSNLIFGNLERTDSKHATISILQVFSLMLYLYFVRLDLEFDGAVIALKMESIALALAGFLSVLSWHYAIKNKFVTDSITVREKNQTYLKLLPEPIVSALTFPFAVLGPDIWTLAWLLLIPVSMTTKYLQRRIISSSN